MESIADANFWHVLIGIESFDEASLRETNKLQNCHRDIVADCRKILAHGIGINGSLIVGFDHDGPEVFDNILQGVQRACIPFASVSILRATHGTKLWTRLREEKRLWKLRSADQFPLSLQMDILPAGGLSRAEIIEGRIYVNKALSKVSNLCERLNGWIALMQRPPRVTDPAALKVEAAREIIRSHPALALTALEIRLLDETLEHARERAPLLTGRIVDALLAQLYWYRIRTYHTEDELKAALAAEKAGDLVPDTTAILLPSAFTGAFRKHLFAFVYARLFRHLPDRQMIPDAASEIFVDFIMRVRDEPGTAADGAFAGPRYEEFLRVLCDRTVARVTGRAPESVISTEEAEPVLMKGVKKTGLYDAVLKEVGDRLSRLSA
jgi:hypothetical protein